MTPYDFTKTDRLIQFALLCAGQEEEWDRRELGRIHLVKYVYLADYHHAMAKNGQTYTGLPWRFHHYGPWATECFARIEPALEGIGAQKQTFAHPKYEDDFVRWSCSDPERFEAIYEILPLEIAGRLMQYIRKFGSDTEGLLDYVYKTPPMIKSAPGETLIFLIETSAGETETPALQVNTVTRRQEKQRQARLESMRLEMRRRLDRQKDKKSKRFRPPKPRYDDVFVEGLIQLDRLAGEPITPGECALEVSEDAWRSKARFDPDLS